MKRSHPDSSTAPSSTGSSSSKEISQDDRLVTLTSPGPAPALRKGDGIPAYVDSSDDSAERIPGRLASLLGSPRAILIFIPLLVVALGMALTVIGQMALSETSRTMARDSFVTRAASLTHGLDNTLSQAEPLLDELSRIALRTQDAARAESEGERSPPLDEELLLDVAVEMRDLLVGRPGITLAYIAYPDGLFLSTDASRAGTELHVTQHGRTTEYRLKGTTLTSGQTHSSNFDPRVRTWYSEATKTKGRTWSRPYTFYFNGHTGVTRAHPLFQGNRLVAVLGVDFDVDTLTAFMAGEEEREGNVKSVLFTAEGIVLAYPTAAERLTQLQKKGEIVSHDALGDASVSALVRHVQNQGAFAETKRLFHFRADDERLLASILRVGTGGPLWYVATFAEEATVLKELYDHRKSSLLVAFFSLGIAVVLAWFLARRLLEVRRAAERAQKAAKKAQSKIRDLGSYRLVARIGEGGMGEVWRANHLLLARDAAIKLIKSGLFSDRRKQEQRERFRREAQAIARLRSRNTVALFDYGVTPEGTLFYVMELLDGIDMSTLVRDHGPQPAERVRKILMQACNSLGEAHNAQLVHRDIKPANLFLCREANEVDVVKVLDFGLVFQKPSPLLGAEDSSSGAESGNQPRNDAGRAPTKASSDPPEEASFPAPSQDDTLQAVSSEVLERITQAEHHLGTPAFMSPEQALGTTMDGRSDIYSLACVAYFLLTGKPPFQGDAPLALMLKHVEEPAPHLDSAIVSEAFGALLSRCLSKASLDRPQTAEEFKAELRALGVQTPDFDEEDARHWWAKHLPNADVATGQRSLRPLHGAEVLRPPRTA